jgi:DNA-binding HxlR family transcriptional regulator
VHCNFDLRTATAASSAAELSSGVEKAIKLIGARWAVLVLAALAQGPRRFSQLKEELGVSSNMLAKRLLEMEANGLVRRARLPAPALIQVYEATEWGMAARPAIEALGCWALGVVAGDKSGGA